MLLLLEVVTILESTTESLKDSPTFVPTVLDIVR